MGVPMNRTTLLCVCCIASLALLATSACAVTYQVRQLTTGTAGPLGASWASAINNSGCVAGAVYDEDTCHAAVGNDLGLLTLLDEGFALGINDSGSAVGSAGAAALWSPAGALSYLPLPDGASFSQAFCVNDAGQAVGECWLGTTHVGNYITVWNGADDPLTLGEGCGIGINSAGTVVGFTKGAGGTHQAFVWSPTGGMIALAGGISSEANAISGSGQVAGAICDGVGTWACTWSPAGDLTLLDNLPGAIASTANGINSSGAVVGCSDTGEGTFAVVWQPDGSIIKLDRLPGDTGGTAYGINDAGQIAGCSLDKCYNPRAVIWNPIPEPAAILAVLTGLIALVPRLRRR